MSTSAVTVTINPYPNGKEIGQHFLQVHGTIAIGAGDYPSGGLPISWLNQSALHTPDPPAAIDVILKDNSATPTGYVFNWDKVNNKIRIMGGNDGTPGDPLVEVATTTPTSVVNGTIGFIAWFLKG